MPGEISHKEKCIDFTLKVNNLETSKFLHKIKVIDPFPINLAIYHIYGLGMIREEILHVEKFHIFFKNSHSKLIMMKYLSGYSL